MAIASVSSGITGKTGKGMDNALGDVGDGFAANLTKNFWGSTVNPFSTGRHTRTF